MDDVIIRSLRGETNDLEDRELADWRASSSANDRHYQEVARVWELGGRLRPPTREGTPPTLQQLLERERRYSRALRRPRTSWTEPARLRRVGRIAIRIAAVLVVGFAAGQFLPRGDDALTLGAAEFVTGPAETVTVRLGDGTVVRLGPESRLRLTGTDEREVWLDGHAFFAVTEQEGRPFRVRTHAGNAMVLGTRFDLRARGGDLRLLVVDGKVELAARGKKIELEASDMGEVGGSQAPVKEHVAPEFVHDELRWMGDFLAFESTPLEQAAREMSLHFGVPVEVLDTTLAKETVHGWFADEELEDVLKVICRAVNAHCSVLPTGVTIEP